VGVSLPVVERPEDAPTAPLVITLDVQPDPARTFGTLRVPAEKATLTAAVGSWSRTWTVETPRTDALVEATPREVSEATARALADLELFPW